MKKQILIGTLMAMMISGTGYTAFAERANNHEHRAKSGQHGEYWTAMAKDLGLSDAQKEQIKTIVSAEKEKNDPLMKQLADNGKQLWEVMNATTFDEDTVRPLAEKQGQLKADLIVSRARVRSQIQAILTPEQRAKAEKIKPEMGRRHKPELNSPDEE